MQAKLLFPTALAVSLIIHLCFLLFLQPAQERKKNKSEESEPVEVSFIPKKEAPRANYIPAPEPPETDAEETTLEHDLPGGKSGGAQNTEKTPAQLPKPQPKPANPPVDTPKFTAEEPAAPAEEAQPQTEPDMSGIFATRDITERIANKKPELPKGEDTASYNAFEQKYASYFLKFRKRVYQLWKYPTNAVALGQSGVVEVTFSILKDGSVVNIKMIKSSGYPELDREVMRVLKNIGKIPLPSSYELNQLNIDEANFIYTIGGARNIK